MLVRLRQETVEHVRLVENREPRNQLLSMNGAVQDEKKKKKKKANVVES
jgi:hypothetical protein